MSIFVSLLITLFLCKLSLVLFSTTPSFPIFHPFLCFKKKIVPRLLSAVVCGLGVFLSFLSLRLTLQLRKSGVNIRFGHGYYRIWGSCNGTTYFQPPLSSPMCLNIFRAGKRRTVGWTSVRKDKPILPLYYLILVLLQQVSIRGILCNY